MTAKPSCDCETCRACCDNVPGWYTPRDVRRLISARPDWRHLVAFDRWYLDYDDSAHIVVMTPPNATTKAGQFYPHETARWFFERSARQGVCSLLLEGRCSIHALKPRECRESYGSKCVHRPTHDAGMYQRDRIARAWNRPASLRFLAWVQQEIAKGAEVEIDPRVAAPLAKGGTPPGEPGMADELGEFTDARS